MTSNERASFEADGSRTWYEPAWKRRISVGEEPKTFVPVELLQAALDFLRRARVFTPGAQQGGHSLTGEINAFLSTFGISPEGGAVETTLALPPHDHTVADWRGNGVTLFWTEESVRAYALRVTGRSSEETPAPLCKHGFKAALCAQCQRDAEKATQCGNPVMVNSERYGPCTLPAGHEGDDGSRCRREVNGEAHQ